MYSDKNLFLNALSNEQIEDILALSDEEQHHYYLQLIRRFYPGSSKEDKMRLMYAYKGSFELEYILRTESLLAKSFTCVYTKTGMIREVSNDLFFLSEAYQYQIN